MKKQETSRKRAIFLKNSYSVTHPKLALVAANYSNLLRKKTIHFPLKKHEKRDYKRSV